jgi:HK97 family phage portal protein
MGKRLDNALSGFGLERKSNPPAETQKGTEKAADMTTGSGAWFDIYGGSGQNITFTQFNNMKQQLSAYQDWVYAAAHTIAEQSASIDFRAFVNNSKAKNASIASKFFTNPERINKYLHSTTSELVTKDGKVEKINMPQLEELEASPVLDLLNNPNPYMSRFEFLEITFLHMELTGNCFWAINRDKKGKPNELWPLMPQFVSIVPDKENFIIGYVYNVNNDNIPFAPDDIIHHKYANPSDLRYGMSTVQAAARAIDTDVHAGDYNRKFFYNSAQPDAVLYTDAEIDEKMYKRLVSQWRDTFGGTANSHRTAILENGLKYQPRVLTQKDMDFLAGRNFNRDMILGIFGVPKGILGLDESMSRANLEAAQYGFMKGKIRPKMERLCDRITQDLAVQFDKKLIVNFTDPVPADKEFLLNEKKTSLGGTTTIPWRTPNEVRAQDGDEPIPGGDFLYISNTLMAMAEDPFQPRPETQPAVIEEDPTKPNDEEEPTDEEDNESGGKSPDDPAVSPAPAAGSTGSPSSIGDKSVTAKKKDKNEQKLQKEIAKKDFSDTRNQVSDKFEVQFLRTARVIFQDQKTEVLDNVSERFGKSYKPNKLKMTAEQRKNLNNLFTAGAWAAASVPIYKGAVQEMGNAAITYAISESNLQNDTDLPEQDYDDTKDGVQKFYDERSTKVSAGIDEETDKQLKASLAEGINAGESVPQLANRVEDIYGAAAGYRAEAIARTESINASTFATIDAWKQSGVVSGKVWTVTSSNPCPYCLDMDGKTVGLGDNYFDKGDSLTVENVGTMTFDYQNVIGPPAHVNCRCDLLPIIG